MERYRFGITCLCAAVATVTFASCGDDPADCELLPERIEESRSVSECARVNQTKVLNGATLTIEPGTTLYFEEDGYLSVNSLKSGATIIAEAGDGQEPITFTSGRENPEPGAWQCVWVGGDTENGSIFEGVEFEYGGAPCEVNGNRPEGMLVINAEIDKVHNAQFLQSASHGLLLERRGRITQRIEDSRFSLSGTAPIGLPFAAVLSVGEGNTYDEGDYIAVDGTANLQDSGEWVAQDAPYRLLADTRSASDGTLNAVITPTNPAGPRQIVTIQPGTTIQLDNGSLAAVGSTLIVEGTEDAPITFTSAEEDPAPGDWGCVLLQGEDAEEPSTFSHAIFEYGGSGTNCTGADYGAPLVFGTGDTSVSDCTFRDGAGQASIISGRPCGAQAGEEPWCLVGNDFDNDLTYETMCGWDTGLYCILDD